MSRSLLRATLTLVGTIIGAGVFVLPQLFAAIGVWPASLGFWCVVMLVLATHVMMADLELHHKRRKRLVSMAREWLGKSGGLIAAIVYPCQLFGALLAYLLLGGTFLATLLAPLVNIADVRWLQIVCWLLGAICVFFGLKTVAKVTSAATWVLVMVLLSVSAWAMWLWPSLWLDLRPQMTFSGLHITALFGVTLFAMSGIPGIAEVVDIVGRDRRKSYIAVFWGTVIAALVTWIFALAFQAAAASDIISITMNRVLALAGFLAVATSFLVLAEDLWAVFRLDAGWSKLQAWTVALCVPLVLLFLTGQSFLPVVDVVGTVFGGITGMLVALMAVRLYRKRGGVGLSGRLLICLLAFGLYAAGVLSWFMR